MDICQWPEILLMQTTNSVIYAYTRLRYQVSVYRTIGPLVLTPPPPKTLPCFYFYFSCKKMLAVAPVINMKRDGPCTEYDTEGWASKNSSCKHVHVIYIPFHPTFTTFLYSYSGLYRGIHIFLTFALNHRLWVLHSSVVRASAV